ncbi:GNAT family N-acetyltransferase [Alteromonas sp. KUL49]|uniref:GNAT family N-acetyltransferase n=1 Tax=Alteromonas sp. KUL49 TaxID=2480798 RepID=UPI00102EDC43|nr:GNAT family N-acetyltransferase [Alteromonas sp. KUL49]TAP39673.1 GNAT family N-acetyltransferase [Alteromonas sp. KUL49]GEA11659.1 hypothetical protein KUL49_20340 [Alteromonas sp. KUL49]
MISVNSTPGGIEVSGYQIVLVPVQEHHLDLLRTWRNSDFVRQQMVNTQLINEAQQGAWFTKLKTDSSQQHWVVYYKDTPIGATNIRTSDNTPVSEAEELAPGLYIGEPKYQGNIIAFAPTLALYDYCFDYLKINALRAEVKQDNIAAMNYNKKLGYREVDRKDMVTLMVDRESYRADTTMIKRFLSR